MDNNKRPESMERITNQVLANAFIDEQIREVRAQVGNKKVLLAHILDGEASLKGILERA